MVELLSPELSYTITAERIVFSVKTIKKNITENNKVKELKVNYQLYISDAKEDVIRYANCRNGDVVKAAASQVETEYANFFVSVSISLFSMLNLMGLGSSIMLRLKL
jgi:hypothetical protein